MLCNIRIFSIMFILCIMSAIQSMQRTAPSLIVQATNAYIKGLLAADEIPSQKTLDKKIPKELQPLMAQMLMKPVIEAMRDKSFFHLFYDQATLFNLPPDTSNNTRIDDAGRYMLIRSTETGENGESTVRIVDIAASTNAFKNNEDTKIIFSLNNVVFANLSRDGSTVAAVTTDNTVSVYKIGASNTTAKPLYTRRTVPYKIEEIAINNTGSRLFLLGQGNFEVVNIPSGERVLNQEHIHDFDISSNGDALLMIEDNLKTIIAFDVVQKKELAKRTMEDEIVSSKLADDGSKCALLTSADVSLGLSNILCKWILT